MYRSKIEVKDLVQDCRCSLHWQDGPLAHPIVLVHNKYRPLRFCVYRLSQVVQSDQGARILIPWPDLRASMDSLYWWCTIPVNPDWISVVVAGGAQPCWLGEITFSTSHWLFQFRVMPFRLCNAPDIAMVYGASPVVLARFCLLLHISMNLLFLLAQPLDTRWRRFILV